MTTAIGIIETRSLGSAVYSVNSAMNLDGITLLGVEKSGDGYINAFISGEYSDIKKTLEYCSQLAAEKSFFFNSKVISNPDKKLFTLINSNNKNENEAAPADKVTKSTRPVKKSVIKSAEVPDLEKTERTSESNEELKIADKSDLKKKTAEKHAAKKPVTIPEQNKSNRTESEENEVHTAKKNLSENPTIRRLQLEALGKSKNKPNLSERKSLENNTTGENGNLTLKQLEELNVHKLRKYARSYEGFPIRGRDISKANRGELLDYFKELV